MSEDNKETVENNETPENQYLEDSFKLFGIFRMPWNDIKDLGEEERTFLLAKADEVEARAKEQALLRQQQQQQQMQQQQQIMQQQPAGGGGGIVTPDTLVTPSQLQI